MTRADIEAVVAVAKSMEKKSRPMYTAINRVKTRYWLADSLEHASLTGEHY